MSEQPTLPTRPRRILIVIGVLWRGGGAEKVAATLGNELTERGHEVHLLTFYEDTNKYPYDGIYHTLNESPKRSRLQKVWGIPRRIWRIARYIRQHQIEHCYSFMVEADTYTLLASKLVHRRVPVVTSVRLNPLSFSLPIQWLIKHLYPQADKVVAPTRALQEILETYLHLTNVTTIYNPIDTADTATRAALPLLSEHQWLTAASPLFVHIGRHIHQKGQWAILRAFAQVRTIQPTAQLVMLGDGSDTPKLQQLIERLELADAVHLLGKQSNVLPYLKAADVAVAASLWEGMPNALLEALSVGTPIISTDCLTGPREILAPELAPSEPITYPYHTPVGTLIAQLAPEPLYATLAEHPLTPTEVQLAEHMLAALTTPYDSTAFTTRAADFAVERVVDAWEGLIL